MRKRDIIVIAGPAGSGKTTAIEISKKYLSSRNFSYEEEIINGFSILVEKVKADDRYGGLNHYHLWCDKNTNGHVHTGEETPIFPFIVTGNCLWEGMLSEVMAGLSALPNKKNMIYFFELAGGVNINPKDEAASAVDHSFRKIKEGMEKNIFPSEWMRRSLAVIHTQTDFDIRCSLNQKKESGLDAVIEKTNTAFVYKLPTVMNIYGNDDFDEIRSVFKTNGISVHDVSNQGTRSFKRHVHQVLNRLF